MKLIIAGNRNLVPRCGAITTAADAFMDKFGWECVTEVVSGRARGVDTAGENWARMKELRVQEFPADWKIYGKAAGDLRNEQMAKYADGALLFFKSRPSPGTSNMLAWMVILNKPFHVVVL